MARFSQEEYENAKNVSLVDYLRHNGYVLKKKGREYCLEEHDSLCINEERNTWFWYSQNKGGSIIQFLQEYEGKTLVEAIYALNNKSNTEHRAYTKYEPVDIKNEKGELILPPKNQDNRRVQAYLSKTRGLDFEIVNSFIKNDVIYESADKHEVVFLSKDKDNNIKYASKRSTLTNSSFRQDVANSNKEFGFKNIGNNNKLFVFESPIDLLSHCTFSKMQGKDWEEDNRVSLGGVLDAALKKFLEENKNIKEIVLFLDNDAAGIENANKIYKKYGLDYNVSIFTTKYKDLNETLVKFKEEKLKNENVRLNDYIIKLNNPVIEPRLQDKEIPVDNKDERDNLINKDIAKKDFIKKSFIPKEQGDNEELYKYLLENSSLSKNKILELINENHIYQDVDRNMVFLVKNEKGQDIGGYSLNIYDEKVELNTLDNSSISDLEKNDVINLANYIKNDLAAGDLEKQLEEFEDFDFEQEL